MSERLVTFRNAWCLVAGFVVSLAAQAQSTEPFRAPNLSPPIAIFGLPVWARVPEATRFGFTTELANHYRVSTRSDDQLILDGETVRVRGYLEKPIGDGWSVGLDVPYFHQSGGILDDVIDGWHSAFGLPDGDRNRRPEGVLEFDLANAGGSFFRLSESGGGIGDVQVSAARQFGTDRGWTLRATIKLPTGRERLLAGSGASDWNLAVLHTVDGQFRGRAVGYYLGGAVLDLGQPDSIAFAAEGESVAAVIGGGMSLGPRFGIKGQIDMNSALYTSNLEEIGQSAVQVTLGAWYQFERAPLLELAVAEDLHVSTTPDVVIYLNLSWSI